MKNPSYADIVRLTPSVLTGANAIPVSIGSCQSAKMGSSNRVSVFNRLDFSKPSVFDRINWSDVQRNSAQISDRWSSGRHNRSSVSLDPPMPELNLDVSLSSSFFKNRQASSSIEQGGNASGNVPCRCCLFSSHSRSACRSPIKCRICLEWGHIANSCSQ